MSFDTQPHEVVRIWAQVGAMTTTHCPWCGRVLRPCNLTRHVSAQHYRQLTIDDVLNQQEGQQ